MSFTLVPSLCRENARTQGWRRSPADLHPQRGAALPDVARLLASAAGLLLVPAESILSRPASPLSSLPPEDEVPLRLGLSASELPTDFPPVPLLAELAAGSPVVVPAPAEGRPGRSSA